MVYVIGSGCCNDGSCVEVCPVDCIRPRPGDAEFLSAEQLYIDPNSCISCAACKWACPVSAIYEEEALPASLRDFAEINREYFDFNPLDIRSLPEEVDMSYVEEDAPLRVAVVGAGPAGCYTASLLSDVPGVVVSIFDRLPNPHGLIRSGVAPDHEKTKSIVDRLDVGLASGNVQSFFNVEIGQHVRLSDLRAHFHAVVITTGTDDDRKLGIPGEGLPGCHAAREFVAWYNGHPDYANMSFDLSGERVVIVGNGNVAIDAARVLTLPIERLARTDVSLVALRALKRSRVSEVVIVGRRGVDAAAFSVGEFLALRNDPDIDVTVSSDEIHGASDAAAEFGKGRRYELASDASSKVPQGDRRRISFRFYQTPLEVSGDERAQAIKFRQSDGEAVETIEASLILRSIGFRARGFDGLPFDSDRGRFAHEHGRVVDPHTQTRVSGIYCAGWIKRGATGTIGTNKVDAAETVNSILEDAKARRLRQPECGSQDLTPFVQACQPEVLSLDDWRRIDRAERERGNRVSPSRPRTKFTSTAEMMVEARRDT